jgi:hypothetical protein
MSLLEDSSIADVQAKDQNPNPKETLGVPGTAIYGGYIVENEKDSRLTGTNKYRTYSNILANTSIVAAGVRYFLNLISKAGWEVEAPEDSGSEGEKIAEQVQDMMNDMTTPWHRVVRRAAMYRFYGFSIQEWTAKVRDTDGAIGFLDIEPRPQVTIERWNTDRTGTVLGMIQVSPQDGQEIYLPRPKTIYMVDDSLNDSPEGLGLFRHLAKTAHALTVYEQLESWGFERDLRGVPVGKAPLTQLRKMVQAKQITEADASALLEPIETFLRRAKQGEATALMLESEPWRGTGENQQPIDAPQWGVELMKGEATSQPEMAKAIERKNREMARVLGVEHLLLGSDSAGSFALSRDKTQSFGLIVDSTLREIGETMEADFLDPLFTLNGWNPELKPSFTIEQSQYRDIEQITTALSDIAKAGSPIMPGDPVVNKIRDLMGLPQEPEIDLDLALPQQLPGEEPVQTEEPEEEEVEDVEEEAETEG